MWRRWLIIGVIAISVAIAALSLLIIYSPRPSTETSAIEREDATPRSAPSADTMTSTDAGGNDDMLANDTMTTNMPSPASSDSHARDTATDKIWCDETNDYETATNCAQTAAYLSHLKIAESGWVSPDRMYVGDSKEVRFAISTDSTSVPVAAVLGTAPTETATLKTGRHMSASLTGAGFDVSPSDVVEKDMLAGAASWNWTVTALDSSEHDLDLSVFVDIPDDAGNPTHQLVRVLHRTMRVDVTWSGRFHRIIAAATDWVTSLTAFAIALKALIVAIVAIAITLGFKRRSGAAKQADVEPHSEDDTK